MAHPSIGFTSGQCNNLYTIPNIYLLKTFRPAKYVLYEIYIKPGSWAWGLKAPSSPPWRVPGRSPLCQAYIRPKGGIQMIITRPSEGLWSSSRACPIQVDRPGARETVPDRFRLVPEDFLMKILTILRKSRLFFRKNIVFDCLQKSYGCGNGLTSSGPVDLYRAYKG